MKYSLHPKELSRWKARITEHLTLHYIEGEVIPSLKRDGKWDEDNNGL